MKKTILIILSVLVVILIGTYIFINHQEKNIKNLEMQVEYLEEEFVPMAFEITRRSDSDINLKAVFYDLDGDKAGSQNIKLNGDEIHIDFRVIDFNDKNFLFFPYGFYTDKMAATDIVTVFDSYDKKDFPEIYEGITDIPDNEGNELNKESRENITKSLKERFAFVKTGQEDLSGDSHGVVVHDLKSISKFKKGFVYEVVCHPHTGAIEIVRR